MTIGAGLGATWGFASETTVGTYQAPTRFVTFEKEAMKYTKNTVQSQALHGGLYNLASRRAKTTFAASGSVDLDLYDRGLGLLFKQMLGAASTPAAIGATGAFSTIFTPADTVGEALSMQFGKPTTAGVQTPFSYAGAKVTDWTLAVAEGGIGSLSVSVDAWNEDLTQTYAAPSYVASDMLHFAEAALYVGGTVAPAATTIAAGSNAAVLPQPVINVASTAGFPPAGTITVVTASGAQPVAYTGITGLTFTGCTGGVGAMATGGAVTSSVSAQIGGSKIATASGAQFKGTNALANARYYLGAAGMKAEQISNGFRALTGQVDLEFANQTDVLNAYYADTASSLMLTFTGPVIVGSVTSLVQILVPNFHWDGDSPMVAGPDLLKITAPFTGLDDGVNSPVQISIVSLDATL